MDQNSTGGTDKRNWRERLGIGTKDSTLAPAEMPKVSDEFKPVSVAPPRAAATALKPAPMAPRPAIKTAPAPGSARPATQPVAQPAQRQAPVAPDALANKLKSQRDAAEKLAEQRVAAAKQRAEASVQAANNGSAEKPKFTFADDDTKTQARAAVPAQASGTRPAPQVQRPVPTPSVGAQQNYGNQIAPPRPQLGGNQGLPPRPAPSPQPYPSQQYSAGQSAYPQGQPYYPPRAGSQQYPQGYQQNPYAPPVPPAGYRPIDPATGYAPPPPYNAQMRPQYSPSAGPSAPRLQVPPRPIAGGFNNSQGGFASDQNPRANPRLTNPPPLRASPQAGYSESEEDDIFEQPAPRVQRRATADDYNQAYREVETGYEDEVPRSRGPLVLLALVGLALAAGLLIVWGYTNYIKNGGNISSAQNNLPVVGAPEKPVKTTPDASGAGGKAVNTSKKQIYDRIVGDREVPGGQLVPSEETPVQPVNNSAPADPPVIKPADGSGASAVPDANSGTGNDGTPLPLPPPPGGTNGTQGSLDPSGKGDPAKTDQAMLDPAVGVSSAAASLPTANATPVAGAGTSIVPAGSVATASNAVTTKSAETPVSAVKSADEVISDVPPEPILKDKKIVVKSAEIKKPSPAKSLGVKPLVLVPPSKLALQTIANSDANEVPSSSKVIKGNEGLYGNSEVVQTLPSEVTAAEPVAAPKQRKTLLDLFKSDGQVSAPSADAVVPVAPQPTQQVASLEPKVVVPAPSVSTGAYVAQLASFKSKAEANAEYSRLAAKHGPIIKRYAPIIAQANVLGTTRYRLAIGPMATKDVASNLCSSLFAAGERDCLVQKQ